MPPEEMWGNDDLLGEWFDEVKIRRKSADNSPTERVPDPPPQGFTNNSLIDDLGLR